MGTDPFDLTDQVVVITGGAGLLGQSHAQAIRSAGGTPVILDIIAPLCGWDETEAGFRRSTTYVAISLPSHSCRKH